MVYLIVINSLRRTQYLAINMYFRRKATCHKDNLHIPVQKGGEAEGKVKHRCVGMQDRLFFFASGQNRSNTLESARTCA